MAESAVRHVILVGLPGVGKTTVGAAVAERLGVGFVDLDDVIESLAGRPIPTIFAEVGEQGFRRLEVDATETVMDHQTAIIASGGGWAANASAVGALAGRAKRIYMKAEPATVVGRMGAATAVRPLLMAGDPVGRVHDLLTVRAVAYEASDAIVDTERVDLQRVIQSVASLAAGWLAGYVAPPFRRG